MNHHEEQSPCQCLIFTRTAAPELLAHLHVKSTPAMPVPLNVAERTADKFDLPDIIDSIDIRAVGVGPLGTRMVQLLARNLAGINCHEIIHAPEQEASSNMATLLSSIRSCDLVFILTGFDDEYCESVAQNVGRAACGAEVLALLITPPAGTIQIAHQNDSGQKSFDSMFSVSEDSLPCHEGLIPMKPESLIGYSMRHMITAVTNLITHRTGICIDFTDLAKIMQGGSLGRMGVGVASDDNRGATAAIRAMERLEAQGVDIYGATGILASVHGSGDISTDDFDAASRVIHEQISPQADILIGMISDEKLGGFVKVTIMSAH
jgi:cell division protein FtsZ